VSGLEASAAPCSAPERGSDPAAPFKTSAQALCELFLPFNRALIVVVTTNLELARENPTRWADWLSVVRRLAADPRALVAANSAYDAAYVAHFARVTPVLLPTLAPYVDAAYAPTRDSYLLAPAHSDAARAFLEGARALCAPYVAVHWLRELYAEYSFEQLASHRAVVFVPYTKSVMSLFELYRMAVPIFAPSLEVRSRLHASRRSVARKTHGSSQHSRPLPPLHRLVCRGM